MVSLNLPIGIQSFTEIRTRNYRYVDKTHFLSTLVNSGKSYFLSRPRRFGKSLFIDTLYCAFSGRKELFHNLYLATSQSGWDFSKTYPVLRVDFSAGIVDSPEELVKRLDRLLTQWETEYSTKGTQGSPGERLLELIPQIAEKTCTQVVILIDEYDKPILDNINNPVLAAQLQDILKGFYAAIKPLDQYLRFVFLTGVSKFAKTGIFSGLNNLLDITIDTRYSAICGYTEEDLSRVFGDMFTSESIDDIKSWYNGYSWTGESVYNPFDILLYLDRGIFRPYWFETGTPSFLIKLWKTNPRVPAEYERMVTGEESLGSFDPEHIRMETLLFQSGYLTIKEWSADPVQGLVCVLGFPNIEVRTALNTLFSEVLCGINTSPNRSRLYGLLENVDISGLRELFHSFFASIPYDWYRKNQISKFEGYYASIFYTYFASLGYDLIAEDTPSQGRIDLTVRTKKAVWIFEFKVLSSDGRDTKKPMEQILKKDYSLKYMANNLPIFLVGIIFDPETRNIIGWEVKRRDGACPEELSV